MKKRKIILTILTMFLILIFILLLSFIFNRYSNKKLFENNLLAFANKNVNTIFTIDEIVMFSSADAEYKTNTANNFTIQNLYQYTDIAIFLENNSDEDTLENTLKSVSISNIKFSNSPKIGTPHLFFKSINDFTKNDIIKENPIEDSFEFSVSSNDNSDLNSPTLYNNLANPLTFSYINTNIKSDYTITDISSPITYNGSLLQRCNISLEDISCRLSFDINIINNLDQKFKTNLSINIPLSTDDNSIYNGSLILKNDTKYNFYRYE